MKYLNNIRTLEQLKKEYHSWALKLHPDMGGNVEEMQLLNNEYDSLFPRVKDTHINAKGEEYKKETTEAPKDFKEIIDKLFKLPNIHIDIIGSFIWVSGDTKPVKNELKEMRFKWHSVKHNWYLAPDWYRKASRKQYSMNEIKDMYGVAYEADTDERKQIAGA